MLVHIRRLLLLTLLSCSSPLVLADEAADRNALEAAAQAWVKAFNARDAETLSALATQDVVLLHSDVTPVNGREAARAAWKKAFASTDVSSTTKEAVIAGDVAWRIGTLTRKLRNGEVESRGQTLEIWKRFDGRWKLHRQMSTNLLAASKLLPRPPISEPALDKPGN